MELVFILIIMAISLIYFLKAIQMTKFIKKTSNQTSNKKEKKDFITKNQEKYNKKLQNLNIKKREYISKGGIEDKDWYKKNIQDYNKYKNNRIEVIMINEKGIALLMDLPSLEMLYYKCNDVSKISLEHIINFDSVKYYKLEGSIHKEQQITGGGGGGSSLKGAIVGGIVAGDVGAIIGSRKKVDEIKTSYDTVDDRFLELTLNNDTILNLCYKCYEKLLDYIPEKEYYNYIENKKKKGRN